MEISNANQDNNPDNPKWYLLAEFSLSEFLSDHERSDGLTAGFLFQMMRELGMPPECVENIKITLTSFAKEALVHFKQGRLELPGRIRVFCQKKIIGNANSARASSRPYRTEQGIKHAQMLYHSEAKMIGGWGYFLIERGGNISPGTSGSSWNSVDLYLYKEGE